MFGEIVDKRGEDRLKVLECGRHIGIVLSINQARQDSEQCSMADERLVRANGLWGSWIFSTFTSILFSGIGNE